jgi:hypothetical protein
MTTCWSSDAGPQLSQVTALGYAPYIAAPSSERKGLSRFRTPVAGPRPGGSPRRLRPVPATGERRQRTPRKGKGDGIAQGMGWAEDFRQR